MAYTPTMWRCPECGGSLGTGDSQGQLCYHCRNQAVMRVRHVSMATQDSLDKAVAENVRLRREVVALRAKIQDLKVTA